MSCSFSWREFMRTIADILPVLPFINVCPFPPWGLLFGQACKALHAQIKHYHTSFQKEYGHPPRRRERVPLVSTYAQYKSWRQFICDDASTQLQVEPLSVLQLRAPGCPENFHDMWLFLLPVVVASASGSGFPIFWRLSSFSGVYVCEIWPRNAFLLLLL